MRQSDVCGQSEIYNLIKVRPKFHLALCYVWLPLVKRSNATPIRSRSGDISSPTNQLIVYKMFGATVGCVKLNMAASMTPRKNTALQTCCLFGFSYTGNRLTSKTTLFGKLFVSCSKFVSQLNFWKAFYGFVMPDLFMSRI